MELIRRFRSFILAHKTEVALLSSAIILRLIALLVLVLLSGAYGFSFPIVGSDAQGYVSLAKSFPVSESFRTPLYPMFIALLGNVWFASIAQVIFGGLIVLLTYKIARRYFGYSTALIAGIFVAVDPIGLYLSSVILTETLFTFTLLLSIYYIDRVVLGGLVLGVATLIRPGALVLIPVFMLFVIISKKKIAPALLFTVAIIIILFPWSARNKILFDSWNLSSVGIYNVFQYHTPIIYSIMHNIPESEARAIVYERAGGVNPRDLGNNPAIARVIFSFIGESPFQYASIYALKTIPFFVTDGITDLGRSVGLFNGTTPNITSLIARGRIGALFTALKQTPTQTVAFSFGVLFWLIVTLGMLYGVYRSRNSISLFFFALIIISALAAGTVSNARIRYPVTPLMLTLATYGVIQIASKTRQRTTDAMPVEITHNCC